VRRALASWNRYPSTATDMPRTLRQLWADEDDAHGRELEHKQRATRLHAKQAGRLSRSVVVHGRNHAK
jgi:hypothetical protein